MTTTLKAPPYVLAHPGDMSGCGFHRIMRPMEIMSRCGVMFGQPQLQFLPDEALKALRPDVVVWQRQSGPDHMREMERYRAALPDAFFVYELDDALGAVPEKSWHRPFMMPGIDDRTAEAVAHCDAVTVTTEGLARYMRKTCGEHIDIRVVPNMLGKDDLHNADMVRTQIPKPDHPKIRIGWGGGIGHKGDLDLLHDAMIALKDEVTWVFLGMNPDVPEGVDKQFMGAAPPHQYLMSLAALRVDLVVAPIEDNEFNHSKSNLRLLEAGACMYPVLASPVEPYLTNKPPVVAHVPVGGWEAAIRDFMKKDAKQRLWHGERMRRWVERHYVMDDRAAERMAGWLRKDEEPFVPSIKNVVHSKSSTAKAIVVSNEDLGLDIGPTCRSVNDALAMGGELDILYVRKGVTLTKDQALRLLEPCGTDVATVSALTNDGGPLGFPVMGNFIPLDKTIIETIDRICRDLTDGQASGMDPTMPACSGPVVVLRRQAFHAVGIPEVREGDWEEPSIIEWSAMASARAFRSVANLGTFIATDEMAVFPQTVVQESVNRMRMRYPQGKFDQHEIDIFRERLELILHKDTFTTGNPTNPTDYSAWVEMRDTIGPESRAAMLDWVQEKDRPVVEVLRYGQEGEVISIAQQSGADWVIFVSDQARVPVHLVPAFLDKIENDESGCTIIYADHDYLTPEGLRQGHDFKPEFDHHMLMGRDYVTTVFAVKVADIDKLKRMPLAYGSTQAQLYDLVLAAIETWGPVAISHLDRILASIPVPEMNSLNIVTAERVKLADAHVKRIGWSAKVEMHSMTMGLMALTYEPVRKPFVSIIIPTRDNFAMILPCVQTILSMTLYDNYQIVIVDNGSEDVAVLKFFDKVASSRVRIIRTEMPFNWSRINNWAIDEIADYERPEELFVFLNDDTRVLAPQWLDQMVGASRIPDVGVVGAKLLYPNGAIQHVGVFSDNGITTHFHKGQPGQFVGYHGIAAISHEATAVTGACMLVSRAIFDEVGGFPEELANNFNDIVFCHRVRNLGLVNVVAMQAELQHLEGQSRVTAMTEEGKKILLDDGETMRRICPAVDPYWNQNLSIGVINGGIYVTGSDMNTLNWKERPWPWDQKQPKRILHLGMSAVMGQERHDGHAIYELAVSGYQARIVAPPMGNVRPFDIRDPASAEAVMRLMEFDEVVITMLGDAPILTLSFLTRLNIPVTYRPINGEAVCPRTNFQIAEGVSCNRGWSLPGNCQSCLDHRGSSNGHVTHMAWLAEWMRFLGGSGVAFDLRFLDDEARAAFEGVFVGDGESIQAA